MTLILLNVPPGASLLTPVWSWKERAISLEECPQEKEAKTQRPSAWDTSPRRRTLRTKPGEKIWMDL